MPSTKKLSIENLTFTYPNGQAPALKNVSIDVYEREWLAIVGHNGSGKSTLAKCLLGLQLPSEGTITVGDFVLSEDTIWDVRSQLGMVFQNPDNQFVGSTVEDDIAFGLENAGLPREEMHRRVDVVLDQVGMSEFRKKEPHQLSGGQKQRVAIASILALQPSVMILDESTSMLDPIGRKEVYETVRKVQESQGISVISITHDLEEAALADRMIVLEGGRVWMEGTPADVFAKGTALTDLGLDLPFPVQLQNALAQRGVSLDEMHLTEEQLVNALWTYASKK
ncbi:energy-coupling factor ABC transporter ATP-binding protein [Bacillus fonticola]|uniref:energy-coupling factor ABC transporter ATP-binding protein n=1 Tax=Bacillus fonticola TaxID=2728853 RepID=UPI001472AB35|nr:energy-coupling factor ABC transporter ATP-binding protein [Bacillus fonticola]